MTQVSWSGCVFMSSQSIGDSQRLAGATLTLLLTGKPVIPSCPQFSKQSNFHKLINKVGMQQCPREVASTETAPDSRVLAQHAQGSRVNCQHRKQDKIRRNTNRKILNFENEVKISRMPHSLNIILLLLKHNISIGSLTIIQCLSIKMMLFTQLLAFFETLMSLSSLAILLPQAST